MTGGHRVQPESPVGALTQRLAERVARRECGGAAPAGVDCSEGASITSPNQTVQPAREPSSQASSQSHPARTLRAATRPAHHPDGPFRGGLLGAQRDRQAAKEGSGLAVTCADHINHRLHPPARRRCDLTSCPRRQERGRRQAGEGPWCAPHQVGGGRVNRSGRLSVGKPWRVPYAAT
jgi:hypothetical protein